MSVLNIIKMGHPTLRKKAKKVLLKDFAKIKKLISDMKETLEFIGASGLAAPQVLENKRIVVYRVNKNRIPKDAKFKKIPWTVMINPIIKPLSSEKELYWERCLSIPLEIHTSDHFNDIPDSLKRIELNIESIYRNQRRLTVNVRENISKGELVCFIVFISTLIL